MKTAVFIPVRISSSRLPRKPLLKLGGKPAIEFLIQQMKSAKLPDIIVLCSTTNPKDKILSSIAERNNIECFFGNEKDIIERYVSAVEKYKIDFVVNVDGDDLLCDPLLVDKTIDVFLKKKSDVVLWDGLPFGCSPFGFTSDALKKVFKSKTEKNTETGWGSYFRNKDLFKIEIIHSDYSLKNPGIRMTLDYFEDYLFFNEIFKHLYAEGKTLHLKEVLRFLSTHPEIVRINNKLQWEYWNQFKKKSVKGEMKSGS